jgi:hypothetical protein
MPAAIMPASPERFSRLNGAAPLRQRGQAILFMLVMALIVFMLGMFVLNAGILTSEKMQLQNAADATAYSVSTIEARDLNFTAYTNRAMVANEVGIAQMVGLMSWASHVASSGPFLRAFFQNILTPIISPIPIAGQIIMAVLTPLFNGLAAGLSVVGNVIRSGVQTIARFMIPAIAVFNRVYSIAQRTFHMVSFLFSISTIDEMLSQHDDDPDDGVRPALSAFGFLALAGHFGTYYSDIASLFGQDAFVTSYRQDTSWGRFPIPQRGAPTTDPQKRGMERLASLVNDSRDPFSHNRYVPPSHIPFGIFSKGDDGGWAFPFIPEISIPSFSLGIGCPDSVLCLFMLERLSFGIALSRDGGTDLRYITRSNQQLYNWSGADTTALNLTFRFSFIIVGNRIDIRLTPGLPFAIGGAQAGTPTGTRRAVLGSAAPFPVPNMMPVENQFGIPMPGEVELDMYGGSPGTSPSAWFPAPYVPTPDIGGPSQKVFANNVGNRYRGLPRYNDTKPGPDDVNVTTGTFGFEAPYLIIGLVKETDDIRQGMTSGCPKFTGRAEHGCIRFTNAAGADQLSVMAKSEVYFSRPTDLGYFRRADGRIEYGSGFNPYWQARLVDTSYLDRVLALAIQQRQAWLPAIPTGAPFGNIDDVLSLLP